MTGTGNPSGVHSKRCSTAVGWMRGTTTVWYAEVIRSASRARAIHGHRRVALGVPAHLVLAPGLLQHLRDGRVLEVLDDLRERAVLVRRDLLHVVPLQRLVEHGADHERLAGTLLLPLT